MKFYLFHETEFVMELSFPNVISFQEMVDVYLAKKIVESKGWVFHEGALWYCDEYDLHMPLNTSLNICPGSSYLEFYVAVKCFNIERENPHLNLRKIKEWANDFNNNKSFNELFLFEKIIKAAVEGWL